MTENVFFEHHKYLPEIAKVYGINAAIIYQHIEWCSEHGHARFVKLTYKGLAKRYQYMGIGGVRKAMHMLLHPARNRPALINMNTDGKIYSYAPQCDYNPNTTRNQVDLKTANKYGVVHGIIMANIGYWIRENWERRSQLIREVLPLDTFDSVLQMEQFIYTLTKEHAIHHERIVNWVVDLHPYLNLRTVRRAFDRLRKEGLLKMSYGSNKLPIWKLPSKEEDKFVRNQLERSGLFPCREKHLAKTAHTWPKQHIDGQNSTLRDKTAHGLAKTAFQQDLTDSNTGTYDVLIEAHIKEAQLSEARVNEGACENLTSSQPASRLANARRESKVENDVGRCPADFVWELPKEKMRELISRLEQDVARSLRKLNKPHLPVPPKVKERKDDFGLPVKRNYTRKPYVGFDPSLPPEEQEFDRYYDERVGS